MEGIRIKRWNRAGIAWFILLAIHLVMPGQEPSGDNEYQYALIEAVKQKNLGNLPEAVKLYKLVIQSKPDCDVAYYELGTIYMVSNQWDQAQEYLSTAYQLDPRNEWYTLAYLSALGGTESYDEMYDIVQEKIKQEPENVEWEYQLASVLYGQGKYKKSIRVLSGIEEERGFSEKITLLKASIYESEEAYDLAKKEIEKVMNIFPEAIQFRVVAAELAMKSGEEEEAAQYYQEILDIDSTNIFALTNLTDYYRKKGDDRKSIQYLTKSFRSPQIDEKRKLAIMSYYLSEEAYRTNYRSELNDLLQVFLEMYPENTDAMLLATDFYIDGQKYEQAFIQLKKYLERNNAAYPIYMQAVLLANAASMNQELIDMTGKALEVYPD
ncbi:MAG: tetratricopeptide repeat protein, partial [Bacteroidales bacterium]